MSWPDRAVEVRAPATSANLGPGFDALGLALAMHDVTAARITGGGLDIEVSGEGAPTASAGERHLVIRAMRAAFDVLGGQPPGISLRCANAIPQGRGLGSSAAAIVTGLLAARALADGTGQASGGTGGDRRARSQGKSRLSDAAVLRLAVDLEGHPDNVSACLAGGLTIAWAAASGPRLARLAPMPGLRPVLCVPDGALPTATARQLLPQAVPHADAAANAARAALLVAALTSDSGLLMDATQDFLHQQYRAAAMPATANLMGRLRASGVPAVVSGAGPAVLALTVAGRQPGPDAVSSIAADTGSEWQVRAVRVDVEGAIVRAAEAPG